MGRYLKKSSTDFFLKYTFLECGEDRPKLESKFRKLSHSGQKTIGKIYQLFANRSVNFGVDYVSDQNSFTWGFYMAIWSFLNMFENFER
jgi:hypothetical protein